MVDIKRFVPVKRTALNGKVFWVVWDNKTKNYSTFTCHGKYETKKECEFAISYYNWLLGEEHFDKGILFTNKI